MKRENIEIEELIADARAEEEVAAEQERAAREEKAREDFRETLREQLKETFSNKDDSKVKVSLKEYVILKQKEADLDRILNAIVDGLGLSYNNEYLYLKDYGRVSDTFRVLYPDVYDHLLAAELAQAENEGE